jgi:hypothetical protein
MTPTFILGSMIFASAPFATVAVILWFERRRLLATLFAIAAMCWLALPLAVAFGVAKINTGATDCRSRHLAACFVRVDD